MLDLLQRLKMRKAESEFTRRDQWLGLVQVVADDDPPDDDNLLTTLDDCGKSLDELEAAVALVKQRREWTAQMATVPAARAEAAAIETERTAARVELFDAQSKYNERLKALSEREQAVIAVLSTGETARQSLQGTSTNQSLQDRIDKAREDSRPIHERHRRLCETRGDRRHELTRVERADNATAEQIEQARKHATELDAEISRLESEQQRLQAEIEAVFAEKLEVLAI